MKATQRILVKLACSMKEEQLRELMSLSSAPASIRESCSTNPIGYLMWLKEGHRSVNSFVQYLEEIFRCNPGFSNFHGIVTEHCTNCEEDDLTSISRSRLTSESTNEQRKFFNRTLFAMKDHITRQDLAIMTAVSPMKKCVKQHVSTPLDLLDKMKECGCICENNVEYLKELLDELQLLQPLQLLLNYEARYPPIRYPPNSSRRTGVIPFQPSPPTMPRGGIQLAEGYINSTRRAGDLYSHSLNNTHNVGSGSEDEYFTASGSPMPSQQPNSSRYQNSSLPNSASLSTFRGVLYIPHDNTYPGGKRSIEATSHSPSSQQQQLACLNNAHSNSPTLPEPSAPLLGELQSHNPLLLRSQVIVGGACFQPAPCGPTMNHSDTNSTPLSSFAGSGEVFCCRPEERQNGPAMTNFNPVPGISNSSVIPTFRHPNYPQSSLSENGAEDSHMSPLGSSLQPISLGHKERTLSESGRLIVQSTKSPRSSNILIPSVGSRMYPFLPSIESSGSEEETLVRKKRKRSFIYTRIQSKKRKLMREEKRWEDGAGLEENVTSVNTEESDEDYHTPPEGD